jgi:AcrR family transcriptional regulator
MARDNKPATRRHPSAERQRIIVETTTALIRERGIERLTVRDIAAAADVSIGTITYHFEGIEELLIEAVKTAMRRFYEGRSAAWLSERHSPTERLRACLDAHFTAEGLETLRLWVEVWPRAMRARPLREWAASRYRFDRVQIEALLRDGIAAGEFPAIDPAEVATELLALVDGLTILMLIDDGYGLEQGRTAMYAFVASRVGVELDPAAQPVG